MIEILDEENERVLRLSEPSKSFNYPYIIQDILKDKDKIPEIKVLTDLSILKSIDFILYAKPIDRKYTWAKKQRYIVYLFPKEAPIEKDFKILAEMPPNHFLELDISNNKIRIVGPFVFKGKSDWLIY